MTPTTTAEPLYFRHHVFFCTNQRDNGKSCCANFDAESGFAHCKQKVRDAALAGVGQVRVNKAGCLDRCAAGPVLVVYPEGVWYTYVDNSDIDEIVESHLQNGRVVERLRVPAHVGK